MDADTSLDPSETRASAGAADLLGIIAYGEISAFFRLSDDARMAPTLRGKVSVAAMAADAIAHFQLLRDALADAGVDVYEAMAPFAAALDGYHSDTRPATWQEALVKAHVGDGLAADFYRAIAAGLPDPIADVVEESLARTAHSDFVVSEVRAAVEGNTRERDRLALWGRRLLGEAVTQAQAVVATREPLAQLVLSALAGEGGEADEAAGLSVLFDTLQRHHDERMSALGLDDPARES